MNAQPRKQNFSFKEELKIIHPAGWVLGGVVLFLWEFLLVPRIVEKILAKAEPVLWVPAGILVLSGIMVAAFVPAAFYVNADAKRRQMNSLLWTLLVIFVPNAIGFIIYFMMRQPIAASCPKCSATVKTDYSYCPSCQTELTSTCPACHRAVKPDWLNCAYCRKQLS